MSGKEKTNGSLAMAPRVITIPAASQENTRKLRVAAYARVSSNSEDQKHSFAAQNAYYSKLITGNPDWELADIYADQGITGTSIDKRDDFLRMMEDCRKGRIDRILVKSSSRFARNTKESLEAVRELAALGVSVYFEEQNIDTAQVSGEVLIAMFAALAQRESEAISERMRWSYRTRIDKGRFSTNKAPFGYMLADGRLEINTEEAEVVKEIFDMSLQGESISDIAKRVSKMDIPTRDKTSYWQESSILYILHNEKYAGDCLLQKTYTAQELPRFRKRNLGKYRQVFVSSRVKWGKHQAMRTGKANIQYKTLLGYEKGPDGEMVVNAEQAETVRKIYELYLSGQTLRNIKEILEAGGFKNTAGTTEWTTSNLRTILSDEKYCGDVLLQKTFIQDCISKKVIKNTGQLPMYLIQNHHEAIIPRDRFDAVQVELARRKTLTSSTKKSAPTGMSRYSGKYALSGLLFCGECGTAYRRVVWTQHGEKRAVWRCSSRLDYGKKYCKESPTLDESPLQQAVLAAINASMSGCKVLADQLVDAMEHELAPVPGESMSLGDIDRAVTELGKQFDTLLAEAANGDADEYAERFRTISTTMEELKRRKAAILSIRQEQEQIGRRIHAAASAMTAVTMGITDWDDGVVYQMLEKVTVLADSRIKVTFRNGVEIEQTVDQPKRRKFA